MAKNEIKSLNINLGGESAECSVPFTLGSVCSGIEGAAMPLSMAATVTVPMGAEVLASRYVYLRITGATGLVAVLVNGVQIGENLNTGYTLNLNIKNYVKQGDNALELRFTSRPDSGILGCVELLRFNTAVIDKLCLTEMQDGETVHIGIRVDALGSIDNVRTVATLVSPSGQMYYGGITRNRGIVSVKNPLLWWPKGLGVQNLYKLTVNLYGDMEIEDTYEVRIGIRTLRGDRDSALMYANGVSYLPMGATYYPPHVVYPETERNRELALLNSAARAGYNTIVIPLSAKFPSAEFFDLCDAHGISVIVESGVDERGELDRSASIAEAAYHASLAYVDVIGGEGLEGTIAERLGVIAPGLDFAVYSEAPVYCGSDSLPTPRTLDEYLRPDERNLFCEKIEGSDGGRVAKMVLDASLEYPYATSLSAFSYVSGLTSADTACDVTVRARNARGTAGRAIFNTLGSAELGASPSALDTAARWKALQYRTVKLFAPVLVSCEHLGGGRLSFRVSNENRKSYVGTLEYRLLDRRNRQITSASLECVVESGTVSSALIADVGEYVAGHERDYYVEYSLRDGASQTSRGTLLFVPKKHFNFADPEIRHEIVGSDRRFSITLSASAFASDVELSFEDSDAVLFDNYFDMTSSAPMKIAFNVIGGIETAEHLSRTLRIRSVYDVKYSEMKK